MWKRLANFLCYESIPKKKLTCNKYPNPKLKKNIYLNVASDSLQRIINTGTNFSEKSSVLRSDYCNRLWSPKQKILRSTGCGWVVSMFITHSLSLRTQPLAEAQSGPRECESFVHNMLNTQRTLFTCLWKVIASLERLAQNTINEYVTGRFFPKSSFNIHTLYSTLGVQICKSVDV